MCGFAALAAVFWARGAAPAAEPAAQPAAPAAPPAAAAISVPAHRQANHVAVLTVEGVVNRLTLRSLERRVDEALKDGAGAIVLELNTPGGELGATLDICHLIKTDAPGNTIAWINPQAYSAGTIIALACREIVVAPNARFGDAAPIIAGPLGLQSLGAAERAKAESPILQEVIDSARRNRYDENLVQSFVTIGIELWMLENVRTGERIFVDRQEYRTVFGEEPPQQLTPVAPPADADPAPVQPRLNELIQPEQRGPATDDPAEQQRQIEFAQTRPPVRQPLTAGDRDAWRPVLQVISDDRLLTVNAEEAKFYGLALATIANDEQLAAWFGATKVTRYDRSWSESMVLFFSNRLVMGVLIVIFIICLVIELASPGLGVFGATAAAALLMLIGAPYLAGMAQWWEILLIVAGLLLVVVELFIIPGFGVAGILGAISLLAGLVGIFVSGDLDTAQGQGELTTGLLTTILSVFTAGVGVWIVSRQLHSLPLFERLILRTDLAERAPTPTLIGAMQRPSAPSGPAAGDMGVAVTDLRPAGRARFGDRLLDVRSVGSFVDAGVPVRIVSAGRFVIEVEEAEG